MKTVTLTYELDLTLTDGEAIAIGDILHVKIELSGDAGANWAEIDLIASDAEPKSVVPEMEKGDWAFRLTVVLTDGRRSKATVVPFNVPSDAPPSEVANVAVTME